MDSSLVKGAEDLIGKLQAGYSEKYGYGSMSCTIYDSAWVAQISKPDDKNESRWVSPNASISFLRAKTSIGVSNHMLQKLTVF
jgi:hypothetical protein